MKTDLSQKLLWVLFLSPDLAQTIQIAVTVSQKKHTRFQQGNPVTAMHQHKQMSCKQLPPPLASSPASSCTVLKPHLLIGQQLTS